MLNGCPQHLFHRGVDLPEPVFSQRMDRFGGMDPRLEKDFVGIEVPDPRNSALIHERRLDHPLLSAHRLTEHRVVHVLGKGIRTQLPGADEILGRGDEEHLPQVSQAGVREMITVFEREAYACPARLGVTAAVVAQPAGHTEVHDHPESSVKVHKQILSMACGVRHPLMNERLTELLDGHAFHQCGLGHVHIDDGLVQGRRFEILPENLYIGQLGHLITSPKPLCRDTGITAITRVARRCIAPEPQRLACVPSAAGLPVRIFMFGRRAGLLRARSGFSARSLARTDHTTRFFGAPAANERILSTVVFRMSRSASCV